MMHSPIRRAGTAFLLLLPVCLLATRSSSGWQKNAKSGPSKAVLSPSDPSVRLLHDHGVKPETESLRNYFKSMLPNSTSRKQQAKLVDELGHADYHVRERAMRTLLRLPTVHTDLLTRAANGNDPEVRWRAGRLLKTASKRSADILNAAYSVIVNGNIRGLAPEVIATMPLCTDRYLQSIAAGALRVTSMKADAALLKKNLSNKSLPIRLASIDAYANVMKAEADTELLKLAADPNDTVKIKAAVGLIRHGNRKALPIFGKLLDSDDLNVRVRAVKILRAVSGKRFQFIAYETDKNRAKARAQWRAWLNANAKTVAIELPLKESKYDRGRLLICDYTRHRVFELDMHQKEVWEHTVARHPWACQGLPNGHRLVASYTARSVTEYDENGKLHWAKTGLPGGPTGVERLENGNTLIACTDSHQVIEVDKSGDTVWTYTMAQRPVDAHRLENGRTLITLQNGGRVIEVDQKKDIQWQLTGLSSPFSAYRLENGNTLVACSGNGSVIEYDRDGKTVWSKTGLSNPYDAQRLANGNTIIGDYRGIREYDRNGKMLWEKRMSGVSKFHRY